MFSCKFFEGNILKKLVESIKDVVNNVNIDVSEEGLSFQAMDLSHVALVTLSLKADGFQEYKSHKNQSLGVKLQNLHKVLKCANASDVITLECEDEPQELNLKFESPDQSKVSKFTLSLMLQEEEQLQIPNTVYSSKVELPSSEFSRIVRELSQLSDSVKIETNKKAITFSVVGDVSSGEMEIKENNIDKEGERICVEVDDPVTMSFSLTFLNSFCKASSLSDSVKLYMSEGTPLVIEYKIGELGELKFYLAPKLSDNQLQFFIIISK